jgi:hypothetical protein
MRQLLVSSQYLTPSGYAWLLNAILPRQISSRPKTRALCSISFYTFPGNFFCSLNTGIFKWKPDYLAANQHLSSAAKKLRALRDFHALASVLVRKATCQDALSNHLGAGIDFEEAAKALEQSKQTSTDNGDSLIKILHLAVQHFIAAAKTERAAAAQLRCIAVVCSQSDVAATASETDRLVQLYEGTSKPVYAADKAKSALSMLLKEKMYFSAMQLMLKLIEWFAELQQPHNVAKMVLSRVILLLADGEVAGARRELDAGANFEGFLSSTECDVAEALIHAVERGDDGQIAAAANAPCVAMLHNQVCRVAKFALSSQSAPAGSASSTGPVSTAQSASMSAPLAPHQLVQAALPLDHLSSNLGEANSTNEAAMRSELFAPVESTTCVGSNHSTAIQASEADLL